MVFIKQDCKSFTQGERKRFSFLLGLILLCMVILLNSCSNMQKPRGDGPPNFYVDESKIPNAVPKPEPLAKYGNYKSYVVFGKRYYTLPTSRYYNEVGIASWYGTKFHNRRTSSGERYNLLAMTAAHKTLPLPTYVEVINLSNHKKVVVKVNDRGPFASNRIIDLSYVAAKKLGMLGQGTTKVKVRTVYPPAYGKGEPFFVDSRPFKKFPAFTKFHSKVHTFAHTHKVYLQVGAFRNKYHAEKLKTRLSSLFPTPIKISHPFSKNQLYRVKMGPFKDMAIANKMTSRLKQIGIQSNKCED